jgi:hypothetical protein
MPVSAQHWPPPETRQQHRTTSFCRLWVPLCTAGARHLASADLVQELSDAATDIDINATKENAKNILI